MSFNIAVMMKTQSKHEILHLLHQASEYLYSSWFFFYFLEGIIRYGELKILIAGIQ